MSNQILENQQEKLSNARRDGELVSAIVDCLKLNKGEVNRQTILTFVTDVIGLTEEERDVRHIVKTDSGGISNRNYYHSAIDFTLTDMKNGKYGETYVIEQVDGFWTHGNVQVLDSSKAKEVAMFTGIKTQKERRHARILRIVEYYKEFDDHKKDIFKRLGGKRDTILDLVEERNCSVAEAFEIFFT